MIGRNRFATGLRGKVALALLVPTVAIVVILIARYQSDLRMILIQRYVEEGLNLTSSIQRTIQKNRGVLTPDLLRTTIDRIGETHPHFQKVRIYTAEGIVIAATERAEIRQKVTAEEFEAVRTGQASYRFEKAGTEYFLEVLSPVFDAGKPVAMVGLYAPARVIDISASNFRSRIIWIGPLGVLILMLVVFLTINRLIVSPLVRLTDASQRVAQGEYVVMESPGGDEIGRLILSFNSMARAIRDKVDQLSGLNQMAVAMISAVSVPRTVDLILAQAVKIFGCTGSGIAWVQEGRPLQFRAQGIGEQEVRRLMIDQGLMDQALKKGGLVAAEDAALHSERKLSLLCGPLVCQTRPLGAICLVGPTEQIDAMRKNELFVPFANLSAAALFQTLLLEDEQRRTRNLSFINEVLGDLSSEQEFLPLLRRFLEVVKQAVGAEFGAVLFLDPEHPLSSSTAARVGDLPIEGQLEGGKQLGFVVRDGQPVRLELPVRPTQPLRNLMGVPLISNGRIAGGLLVANRREGSFRHEDQNFVMSLGAHCAPVLEKILLFERIHAKSREVEEKNREMETFVYTVSHDLKTPVVSLQGLATALRDECEGQLAAQGKHYLERLVANTTHIERLIHDLLDLSRAGRLPKRAEEIHTKSLLEEVLLELSDQTRKNGVEIIVPSDLPTVWGDPLRLQEVFTNLLTNAIKFKGPADRPRIEVGANVSTGEVEFWVRDNGIGIDPAYHDEIFAPFRRLQEVPVEGTGVGLAIVKKIVETAGGGIRVASEKGKGSTFSFTWPRYPSEAEAA